MTWDTALTWLGNAAAISAVALACCVIFWKAMMAIYDICMEKIDWKEFRKQTIISVLLIGIVTVAVPIMLIIWPIILISIAKDELKERGLI